MFKINFTCYSFLNMLKCVHISGHIGYGTINIGIKRVSNYLNIADNTCIIKNGITSFQIIPFRGQIFR